MGALVLRRQKDAKLQDEVLEDAMQYLTFQLHGETFAVRILAIKEILEYSQPTLVPLMPSFIRGVMNLRGTVVPVIDLAVRFGQAETVINRRSCVVIIELHDEELPQFIGIVVDQVNEVLAIRPADIEPPPQFGSRIRVDFISGMAKIDSRFVILLEIDRVLSVEEMVALGSLQEMPAGEPADAVMQD